MQKQIPKKATIELRNGGKQSSKSKDYLTNNQSFQNMGRNELEKT
jgi:hypothetical protein